MSGQWGKEIDRLLRLSLDMTLSEDSETFEKDSYKDDLKEFVESMTENDLFAYEPQREHVGFPKFKRTCRIKSPLKLGKHLRELSEDLDFWREEEERTHSQNN